MSQIRRQQNWGQIQMQFVYNGPILIILSFLHSETNRIIKIGPLRQDYRMKTGCFSVSRCSSVTDYRSTMQLIGGRQRSAKKQYNAQQCPLCIVATILQRTKTPVEINWCDCRENGMCESKREAWRDDTAMLPRDVWRHAFWQCSTVWNMEIAARMRCSGLAITSWTRESLWRHRPALTRFHLSL